MTAQTAYDWLLPARRVSAGDALARAIEADQRGWRGIWSSEVLGLDTIALSAAILASTSHVRVGTAVVPVTTRSAALLAMSAATLAQLAPGRFHLGLGVSTPAIVAERHDRPVRAPLAETRGTLEVVRTALTGATVSHPARPAVHQLRIEPPEVPPPVSIAALGPRMTDLAVAAADGLMLNMVPLTEAVRRAAHGRAKAGRPFETFLLLRTCVEPSDDDLATLSREIASYARVPVYAAQFAQVGLDIDAVVAAPDLATAGRLLPAATAEAVSVTGSAASCREQLDALVAAGVTPLVIGVGDAAAQQRTFDALSPG